MLTLEDVRAVIDQHIQAALSGIEAMMMPEEPAPEAEPIPTPEVVVEADPETEIVVDAEGYEIERRMDDDEDEQPGIIQRFGKAFRDFLAEPAEASTFRVSKTKDGRFAWFARWSNNFKDRDGEWFSEKAIQDYVKRVDHGLVEPPELWAYHMPGTKHGRAEFVAQVGHFVVSAGYFDDTPRAQKAAQAYNDMRGLGMSHGFVYDADHLIDGVYHQFNTFEISVLPRKAAANPYTTFEELKDMSLTDEKRAFLRKLFGDSADAILADTEKASKALEEANVAFKDFASLDTSAEHAAVKSAALNAEKNFAQLVTDVLDGQSELADTLDTVTKAYTAARAEIEQLSADVAQLKAQLDGRPKRASQSTETTVEESALPDGMKNQFQKHDPFWGVTVKSN